MDAVQRLTLCAPALATPLANALCSGGLAETCRHPLLARWQDQSAWSDEILDRRAATFDNAVIASLRLLRTANSAPGAGLWLTALPNARTPFTASEWQCLLRFRVGAPCFAPAEPCSGCGITMDPSGDHALCCAHNGLYRRHNHVRGALYQLAKSANWSPVLEAALPNSSHRPADILLRSAEARPLAIDVTIVHPLRPSDSLAVRVQRSTSAAADAEVQKSARNRQACE